MSGKTKAVRGQGIVEYTGAILLATLIVAACLSGANTFMPTIFSTVSSNNETAFSDDTPVAPQPGERQAAPPQAFKPISNHKHLKHSSDVTPEQVPVTVPAPQATAEDFATASPQESIPQLPIEPQCTSELEPAPAPTPEPSPG